MPFAVRAAAVALVAAGVAPFAKRRERAVAWRRVARPNGLIGGGER